MEINDLKARAFDISIQIESLVNERNQTLSALQKALLEEQKKKKKSK